MVVDHHAVDVPRTIASCTYSRWNRTSSRRANRPYYRSVPLERALHNVTQQLWHPYIQALVEFNLSRQRLHAEYFITSPGDWFDTVSKIELMQLLLLEQCNVAHTVMKPSSVQLLTTVGALLRTTAKPGTEHRQQGKQCAWTPWKACSSHLSTNGSLRRASIRGLLPTLLALCMIWLGACATRQIEML